MKKQVPWSPPEIGDEEKEAAKKVIDSEWITQGKITKQFEEEIAKVVSTKNAVMVSNGTCALMSGLLAHGIGPGDEVIVPNFTFIATVNSVYGIGAKPVLVDCDEKTWNTTPELVEEKITSKSKAFIPIDVGGMPVDIDAFQDLADEKNLTFIHLPHG
jgi:perosamine synthetase